MADLKPGRMGPASSPQVPSAFTASMAQAMENAYRQSLVDDGKHPFETAGNSEEDRDRRRIFVAIAQGVVGHLAANTDAIKVVPQGTGWRIEIRVMGP